MLLLLYDIEVKKDPKGIRVRLVRALKKSGAFHMQKSAWILDEVGDDLVRIIDEFRAAGGIVKIAEWLPRTLDEVVSGKTCAKKIFLVINGAEPIIENWHRKIEAILCTLGYFTIIRPVGESAIRMYAKDMGIRAQQLLFKESVSRSLDEIAISDLDGMVLLNSGRSAQSGIIFGAQTIANTKILRNMVAMPIIQIERAGKEDGAIIVWNDSGKELAVKVGCEVSLPVITPSLEAKIVTIEGGKEIRQIHFANVGDRIVLNGSEVGICLTDKVFLIARNGKLIDIIGGKVLRKAALSTIIGSLSSAIVKTVPSGYGKIKKRDDSQLVEKSA